MKLNFPVLAYALSILALALLCLPTIGQDDFWSPPPLDQIQTSRPGEEDIEAPGSPDVGPLNSTLKIVSPAPNDVLKGVVEIRVEGLDKSGFAVFRLNDEFAYATIYPYKMRWDTQGAQDGRHIIRVTGYSMNARIIGVTSLSVTVKNRIAFPSGGSISLGLRPQSGAVLTREIDAISNVAGLGGDITLPSNLLPLKSRLFARIGQSIAALAPGGQVDIRSTIRQGSISNDKQELPFKEKGYYGIYMQSPSGLAIPPSSESRRPRIGLAEISLEAPREKVREGASWVGPMRVIADLVQRNSIQVMGTHTFEGLWWMNNRKCARIASDYTINEISLITGSSRENALLEGFSDLPQPEVSGVFSDLPGIFGGPLSSDGEASPAAPPIAAAPGDTNVALLRGLTGTRTTWIDIERGVVVRTEDDLAGTFVFSSRGNESGVQHLPYNLSLTQELVD